MNLAVVLGTGGERATAWELGVLAGLAVEEPDVLRAERVLATSAGLSRRA